MGKGKPVNFVKKGWGSELWIVNKPEYCGKILHMDAGKQLSWHYHILKDETFYVQSGRVRVIYGDTDDMSKAEACELQTGDTFYVPRGLRHRLVCIDEADVFEFSTEHFDEDSIRVERGD